ncbi:MAG: beta-galactosidase [Clostridia bacterium]|nr:beta-galactosidase [Clostridia bacterium]
MFRPEYPRPQLVRQNWINLNGAWEYQTDRVNSGLDRKLMEPDAPFTETINVPFCRESELSGIGDKEFCDCVWYRKKITLPENWAGKRVLLHIGACDFYTTLWVDGKKVGDHRGGFSSFSFELTPYLEGSEATLVLRAFDDIRSRKQAAGKQSKKYYSYGCSYTRTTGIWQTVWLEAVEQSYITETKYYPDIDASSVTVQATADNADGMILTAKAFYKGTPVGEASATVHAKSATLTIPLSELHLWECGKGRLYDLELTLGDDRVKSYFGMRNIGLKDGIFYLNNQPVFQRLVLDQGFYPDGIFTAPSEQALIDDIERSMALGFNGARLHQKIFEPVFLYHCDRLGYIVWGEHGNWMLDISAPDAWKAFLPEWLETVKRDFNHPAIIGWCPLNETQADEDPEFVKFLADVTRAYDSTRLYIETSGWYHISGIADIVDVHDYEPDPAKLVEKYEPLARGEEVPIRLPKKWKDLEKSGKPTFVSEYGGIYWNPEEEHGIDANHVGSWGYGDAPRTQEEFVERFKGQTEALLFHPRMGALCYTQLTDVEQEQNGLYTYNRVAKFDPAIFHAILTQPAAIEKKKEN